MKQSILEAREKLMPLIMGVLFIVVGVVFLVGSLITEGDSEIVVWGIIGLLFFGLFGGYLIAAYVNHRLRVFADGSMEYSNTFGKKIIFHYSDLAKVEQRQVNGILSLTLKDSSGKCIGKVESNMAGYEELAQWLNTQKQKAEDTENMGIQSNHEVEVTPVNGSGNGKAMRILFVIFGLFFLVVGIGCAASLIGDDTSEQAAQEVEWFDPYTDYEDKRKMEFEMISYPFASLELSDSQEFYFIFDSYMSVYIICMESERLETEFADIYEYTFNDSSESAGIGMVEGYAMEIDEELKEIAIEEFNYLWGSEIFNELNFEDYVGCYYLDTTFIPEDERESPVTLILGIIFGLVMGVYLIYCGVKPNKKEPENALKVNSEVVLPPDNSAEGMGITYTPETACEIPAQGNLLFAMLASFVGAAIGGVVWILVYKLGYITSWAGILAVAGAITGYSKFGKRELTTPAAIWCCVIALCTIGLANYISYAWDIADAINAAHPGRTDFAKVFVNMPELMKDMDLWVSFIGDMAMGLFFALLGGVGSIFGNKKKN